MSSDFDIAVLESDFDQPIDVVQEEFMHKVNRIIEASILEKSPDKAIKLCKFLIGATQLSGLALAKILYELQKNWWKFGIDEDFTDYIYKEIGKHHDTVDKYLAIADMLGNYAPKDVKAQLEKMPVGSLIPIAHVVRQGYQLEHEDWQEFTQAINPNDVRRIVREIKGLKTGRDPSEFARRSLITLVLDRNGSIWVFNNNEERFFVGSLDVREAEDNEYVAKAIERIVGNTGILRK